VTADILTGIKDRMPAGWALLPLKRVAAIRYGLGQPPPEITDGVPLLRATNVNRGKITDAGLILVDPTGVPLGRDARLSAGEIIVVRSGAYTGDSAIVPARFDQALAGYDMVVRPKSTDPRFLAWQLLSGHVADFQYSLSKSRAAQPHLNAEELGETLICQPPPFSQRRRLS
jgi:type I restriction enzyme S subunit